MLTQTVPSIDEICQLDLLKVIVLKADPCPLVDFLVYSCHYQQRVGKQTFCSKYQ